MARAEPTAAGIWVTIDDNTHKPRGTVRIYEQGGLWFGRIVSAFDPSERNERCTRCAGDRRGKPVIGIVFLRGMIRHGSDYAGGDILDPETGFVYRCHFTLSPDGNKLTVRGYLGISLIGRTQIWIRQEPFPKPANP